MNLSLRLVAALLLIASAAPVAVEADPVLSAGLTLAPSPADACGVMTNLQPELIRHIIPPQCTDDKIDTFQDLHYVWVNSSRKNDPRLWVFLPSALAKPADFQLIGQEVARLGYHVINLMYPNADQIINICNPLPDSPLPDRETCYENIRLQTLDGVSRPCETQTSTWCSVLFQPRVNAANSVDNRLEMLLQYLAKTFPDEGWKDLEKQGAPVWSRITIAGHSQGGGNAALIGKLHHVARVVMISSPPEGCVDTACSPAGWVTNGATPSSHYYGLAHQREQPVRAERSNWTALGLDPFGAPVAPETSAPPYGCTHMLLTNLDLTRGGNFHNATARDSVTPLFTDGTPKLASAWRYLAGGESDGPVPNEGAEDC